MSHETQQSSLPYESGPIREVSWFKAARVEKTRRFFRNKVLTDLIIDPATGMAAINSMPSSEISKINDPDLRYALRFSDAAQVAGNHFVQVEATDDEFGSQLVEANYSGIVKNGIDTFLQDLHRQAPQPEVPGMTAVLVAGEDGNPDTRFWVTSR